MRTAATRSPSGSRPVSTSPASPAAAVRPERVYAGLLAGQAVLGVVFWVTLATAPTVRSWFELMPSNHEVMDAFVFADVLVVVVGSSLGAWGLWTRARWALPVIAFTAGGVVYPTLYLLAWVSFAGTGAACLAIMVPVSTLTAWVCFQTWRLTRRSSP